MSAYAGLILVRIYMYYGDTFAFISPVTNVWLLTQNNSVVQSLDLFPDTVCVQAHLNVFL